MSFSRVPLKMITNTCAARTIALLALFACAVACTGSRAAAAGETLPVPEVAACANPRLPADILDGSVKVDASPLPVVQASAGATTLKLAVADDDETRELGLMCVTRLRPQHGMIFVFPTDQKWEFWMKNTLVPLDMIWARADGTITTVASNVPASTRETPDDKVARRAGIGTYVIELTAGEAVTDKLTVGKRLVMAALHASH